MSLRARITVVVSGFTAVIVLIAGAMIHQLTEEDLRNQMDRRLSWQVAQVMKPVILAKILDQRLFFRLGVKDRQEVALEKLLDVQIPTRLFVNGDSIVSTRGFPHFSETAFTDGFANLSGDNGNWRVLTQFVPRSVNELYPIAIQASFSRKSIDTTLQDIRSRVIAVFVMGVLAAGMGGWFLGGTVLRPIIKLRGYAENIRDSKDLSERVPINLGPSEVETLAKSFNEMLERLEINVKKTEESLSSSRLFATNVAHELRTPLTSIRTNLDLLARYSDMQPEERGEIISDLVTGQDRLLSTLESLRLLSRGDLSEGGVFEEIDFLQFIQEIITHQMVQWPDASIRLRLESDPPLVLGWKEGLSVMFRNVIENAGIHAKVADQGLIVDISARSVGKELHIDIDDNGLGIPLHERDHVMERFNRGSRSMGAGSGLGLSLVKQQVELHGGMVVLADNQFGGTRVSIVLPIIL